MNFKFIESELDPLGLTLIPLNALIPDDSEYSILLNQFKGDLAFSEKFIGNSEATHDLAKAKFDNFLSVGSQGDFDLVACPEYSCPWASISTTIEKKQFPNAGKVWILGAESITPLELLAFVEKHSTVEWIYDNELAKKKTDKFLFDPACIFFKVRNGKNEERNVCVIQFKNKHMSVHGDELREVDVLIEGNCHYIIRNNAGSVKLLTIICSDSLVYNQQAVRDNGLERMLLIHIQMNPLPRHTGFKKYREAIFDGASSEMEIICLNWAKGSMMVKDKILFSGSGYFTKSNDVVLRDERLNSNQKRGLYYTFWKDRRSHLYFYSSEERLLSFKTHKTSQTNADAGAHRRRDGAVGTGAHVWNDAANRYDVVATDDSTFAVFCDTLESDMEALKVLPYVDQERLIKLSSASTLGKDSFEVKNCDHFVIDNTEIIRRLTYMDEIDDAAIQLKTTLVLNLRELITIFNKGGNFSENMVALKKNTVLSYSKTRNPFVNVYTTDCKPVGTIIYLSTHVKSEVIKRYNYVQGLMLGTKSEMQTKPLIIIWYEDNGRKSYWVNDKKFDADINESQVSITREKP